MPNVTAALPNIGGALCSTPQSLADAKYLAVSRPKFTILSGHAEELLLFNKFFFPIVDTYLSSEDYNPTKLCDGAKMAIFLRPVFPVSRVQHVSDLHPKFALRPHHVWKYGRHPISNR